MNTEKISVIEYLENKELLEINYTPYDTKVQIVNTIISSSTLPWMRVQ
jgi:hypothetical protein